MFQWEFFILFYFILFLIILLLLFFFCFSVALAARRRLYIPARIPQLAQNIAGRTSVYLPPAQARAVIFREIKRYVCTYVCVNHEQQQTPLSLPFIITNCACRSAPRLVSTLWGDSLPRFCSAPVSALMRRSLAAKTRKTRSPSSTCSQA